MYKMRMKSRSNTDLSLGPKETGVERVKEKTFPKFLYFLFYFFGIYLVLPFFDVPLLGLSLSAPIMFFIALFVFIKPPTPWLEKYQRWIVLPLILWFCLAISTTINGFSSLSPDLSRSSMTTLLQYLYWNFVFIVTTYFASQGQILKITCELLGWSVIVLSIFRLSEVFLGNILYLGTSKLLTANAYGLLFSTFSPFLYMMLFQKKGQKKFLAIVGTFFLIGAVLINGSRGSWISITTGLGITLIILFFNKPRKFSGLVIALIMLSGALVLTGNMLPQVKDAITKRFSSFSTLEEDKATLVRELMLQKGIRLFQENPVIGVGAGRFTKETVELDIPKQLAFLDQSYYDTKSSHNSYVQFLAEFGLLGVIPLVILLLSLVINGARISIINLRNGDLIPLTVCLSFIQLSMHLFAISSLTNTNTWFVYGLVAAVIMRQKQMGNECA